jgi:GntR family transcriptional repressor for pyruvate dehydrogenase complex
MLAVRRTRQDITDLSRCIDDLSELIERDSQPGNPAAWADAAYRFHALMLERAGNQTLALQAGVLQEVVATHMSTAVSRTFDRLQTVGDFRKAVRGYRKLVSLVEARDVAGAEQYWRTHMEVAWKRLLKDFGSTAVVDLFT